jgi:hypothetical protein
MAEPKKPVRPGTKGLEQDEIIARLVPDPSDPPDVVVMVGFLGESPKPKFWRLYQTLDLKDYAEIAEEDIVYSQSLTTELQPLGGTVIWIKSGARLKYSQSESRLAEAEFMQGDITRNFLAGTGTEGLPRWGRAGVGGVLRENTYYPCTRYNCGLVAVTMSGPRCDIRTD